MFIDENATRKVVGRGEVITQKDANRLLGAESGSRPRIYGYLATGECAGQTIALRSQHTLHTYRDDLQFVWLSNTTLSDLISQA